MKTRFVTLFILMTCLVGRWAEASIIGYVDAISQYSSGHTIVYGWACQVGSPNPVNVVVQAKYVGWSFPGGYNVNIGQGVTNQPSESAINSACQSTGTNYRY